MGNSEDVASSFNLTFYLHMLIETKKPTMMSYNDIICKETHHHQRIEFIFYNSYWFPLVNL